MLLEFTILKKKDTVSLSEHDNRHVFLIEYPSVEIDDVWNTAGEIVVFEGDRSGVCNTDCLASLRGDGDVCSIEFVVQEGRVGRAAHIDDFSQCSLVGADNEQTVLNCHGATPDGERRAIMK